MDIEVLVATMHRKNEAEIIELVEKMNISTNCVVINQNDFWEGGKVIQYKGNNIKYISVIDRGLSKSRNLALQNATADIVVIADDDMIYEQKYANIILDKYQEFPEIDAIGFFVERSDFPGKMNSMPMNIPLSKIQSMKFSSVQLTFRKESIQKMEFDENFGSGALYSMGEENIFLFDFLKEKNQIMYSPLKIAFVNCGESTWFTGFNTKYLQDKGAAYQRMFGRLTSIMNLQFVIRKRKLFPEISILKAYKNMRQGSKLYFINKKHH